MNQQQVAGETTVPPDAGYYDCGRRYRMPPAGQAWHYGEREDAHLCGSRKECVCAEWPAFTGASYSMLIMDDFWEDYDDPNEPERTIKERWCWASDGQDRNTKQRIRGRASDVAAKWERYGCVLIKGQKPTDAELKAARGAREQMARSMVERGKAQYERFIAGHKDGSPYQPAHREWAAELGVLLDDAASLMPRSPDTIQCPICRNDINRGAQKCVHCNEWLVKREPEPVGAGGKGR